MERTAKTFLPAIQIVFEANNKNVGKIAKVLEPSLLDPALHIAISDATPETESSFGTYPRVTDPSAAQKVTDPQHRQLAAGVTSAARDSAHAEAFMDFLGPIVTICLELGGLAVNALRSLFGAQEFSTDDSQTQPVQIPFKLVWKQRVNKVANQRVITYLLKDR